jgi:inositol phosphorylceramide mannosyltransferase catalytic subunit
VIPRVIHLIWFGPPIPEPYLAEVRHLGELNPDWAIRWWHEEEVLDFGLANRALFDTARTYVPPDSVYQLQSDLARYEILYRHGGVYVDLDYRWQKPLNSLLLPEDILVTCWEQQGRHVANGFIAARPRQALLGKAMRDAKIWCDRWGGRGLRANRLTGPGGMWTSLTARSNHVRLLNQSVLHPVPWRHPEWADTHSYPDAAAIHLWGHQRSIKGKP